jgi:hypothetical protein
MKIKALVAKTDGVPDRKREALASGSITAAQGIQIVRNFDPRLPSMGLADLVVEGTDVYADIDLTAEMEGLYPALSGRAVLVTLVDGIRRIDVWTTLELSLCDAEDTDPRVGRIQKEMP